MKIRLTVTYLVVGILEVIVVFFLLVSRSHYHYLLVDQALSEAKHSSHSELPRMMPFHPTFALVW